MRCVCKYTFNIDGITVGDVGDIVRITDAVPEHGENYEDVDGYCDIFNEFTGITFNATWLDVDERILERIN